MIDFFCRSYYFSVKFLETVMNEAGFQTVVNTYVHRRTINKKECIDVPRIFIQGKFQKPKCEYYFCILICMRLLW